MTKTDWYHVWFDEVPDALIAYPHDLRGVNEYRIMDGKRMEDWPPNVTLLVRGKHPEDYVFCVLTGWMLMSKRVQQVFERYGIRNVQFLPVHVIHEIGVELPGYALLNVLALIPALDREHTVWLTKERDRAEYPGLNILRVALSRSAIPDIDIFRLEERPPEVYISHRLKEIMEREGTTLGFKFKPVATY